MKRIFPLVFILLLVHVLAFAQHEKVMVSFTDKKGTAHTIANPHTYLSPKAIERRTRQKIAIDSTDLPVSGMYLDSIRQFATVTVVNTSKWLNHVLISTNDATALERIRNFPFVKSVRIIEGGKKSALREPEVLQRVNEVQQINEISAINYGNSYNQIHIHEGEYLHERGFTGRGITIAVFDAGFNSYKTNPAFDSVRSDGRILGEWDFVAGNASVNEDHSHGANCLSIIAANRPGVIVGSAPHASFWLLRTENVASETLAEEENWAAAAEFADSAGADMISSSLGYIDFDNPSFDHSYADRDGNTSLITRAADMAAQKGLIVVNSAGNYGLLSNDMKYVGCPADGDSVFTVGGVDVNGNLYALSSWGPNSSGLVKPNVVSVGQGTVLANAAGNPVTGNGTSYACPNMAGLIACLWQAFPEFTNMEILSFVQKASNRYAAPHERFGYGIPNFALAYNLLSKEREARTAATVLGDKWIKVYPNPFPGNFNILVKAPATGKASFRLYDVMGRLIETKTIDATAGQVYIVQFSNSPALARGLYYVRYNDGETRETLPIIKR